MKQVQALVHEQLGNTALAFANSPVVQLGDLKQLIAQSIGLQLVNVDQNIAKTLATRYVEVQKLADRASAHAGKRLRPILVLLSAQASGESLSDSNAQSDLVQIAASVELVHLASLVHDDLMDHAETRRHQPTVAHACGSNAAVLLGDYLFTRAYAAAANCRSTLPARTIARAATQLCSGELRQQLSSRNWQLSRREYYSILFQKTAALCQASCKLGSWRAAADRSAQAALSTYGKYLGLAFQIHDDWLDYWGSESVGKTLGTDLAQSKPTLPLLLLLSQSGTTTKSKMIAALDDPTEANLNWIREMIQCSSAGPETLNVARRMANRAILALEPLADTPAKRLLEQLAVFSVSRAM